MAIEPELPCWDGHTFTARAQSTDAEDGRPTRLPQTSPQDVLMLACIASGVLTLFGAVVLSVVSVLTGHGRLILTLLLVHLPYAVFAVRLTQINRRTEQERDRRGLPPQDLLRSPLGFLAMHKAAVRPDGVYSDERHTASWSRFTHAAVLSEAEGYFVVRLHKRLPLQPLVAPLLEEVERKMNSERKRRSALRFWSLVDEVSLDLALLAPPLATVCVALHALSKYGWRVDVLAALCLAAFYTTLLLSRVTSLIGVAGRLQSAREITESATLDLLFDSRQVTQQAAVDRMNGYIGGAGAVEP